MSFVYPLGLLGLIGIPILIIIYIIKNKYTEQTIASTYLWNLSERFLKNRKPISKLKGLINLILQCLAVLVISLLIARPIIHIPNSANEFCFILDGSGSMLKENAGQTRFDKAKMKIKEQINSSKDGSVYNLILVGNDTQVIFEDYTDKKKALDLLEKVSSSYIVNNCADSLSVAQNYFNSNPSIKTYLYTDKNYSTNNIELVDVSNKEENYALYDATYNITPATYGTDGEVITAASVDVTGNAISYENDKDLSLELYMDGKLVETKNVLCLKGVKTPYSFTVNRSRFSSFEVKIANEDCLALDNSVTVYNLVAEHNYKALVVSKNPFYLLAVLEAYGVNNIEHIEPDKFNAQSGYGLYIFDSCTPSVLPSDGTIWFFNQKESLSGTLFTVKDEVEVKDGALLELENIYGEEKKLVEGLIDLPLYVKSYVSYGINKRFTTLYSCQGNPVVFSGNTVNGNREIVFGFDLHNSNLPLSYNFLVLFNNLLDYSFPNVIETSNYTCGDEISINVLAQAKSIRLETPNGKSTYLDTSSSVVNYSLTSVGTYKLTITLQSNEIMTINFYSGFPQKENEEESELYISLVGEALDEKIEGTYDPLIVLFVLLGLLFIADWMVYCYEQHQLY